MPSKMRHGLLISLVVISLMVISFNTSFTDTTNYIYDELNRLIRVEYGDGNIIEYIYDKTGNRTHLYVGKYALTVNVVGNGTVTKNPDQPIYSPGTNVTLTAVDGSQTFSEWSGDLTGSTNPSVIEMDGNKSVTATFTTRWLQGWTYRKAVTLSRASGAVTNYQMKLLVGESSGASGEDVDCNGHVQADFDDLRFTKSDKTTLLDYWIESITGTTPNQLATVWIEFDSIGTEATTFYMYYGKADAAAVSNGGATFIVFDDFERGNNGDPVGGNWTVISGSVVISTDHAFSGTRCLKQVGGATHPYVKIPVAASDNISIRVRIWKEANADWYWGNGDGTHLAYVNYEQDEDILYYNGGSWIDTGVNITPDQWELVEYNNFVWAAPTVDIWHNNVRIVNDGAINYHFSSADVNNQVRLQTYYAASGEDMYVEDFIVRNFRVTEPAWGSWEEEEAN